MRSLPHCSPLRLALALGAALGLGGAGPARAEAPGAIELAPVPGLDEEEGDVPSPTYSSSSPGEAPAASVAGESPAAEPPAPPQLATLRAEPVRGIASSGFGWRDDPIRHRRKFHYGGDFRAPRGTPVYAAGDGVVSFCGRRNGYGKVIDVRHGGSALVTRYAHLSSIDVKCGQAVTADQLIGKVGSTGRATGPHLHFEVRIDGQAVDPTEAMRVAELQRDDDSDETRRLAQALRASAATAVSTIDPPRARSSGKSEGGKSSKARRRRPVS